MDVGTLTHWKLIWLNYHSLFKPSNHTYTYGYGKYPILQPQRQHQWKLCLQMIPHWLLLLRWTHILPIILLKHHNVRIYLEHKPSLLILIIFLLWWNFGAASEIGGCWIRSYPHLPPEYEDMIYNLLRPLTNFGIKWMQVGLYYNNIEWEGTLPIQRVLWCRIRTLIWFYTMGQYVVQGEVGY